MRSAECKQYLPEIVAYVSKVYTQESYKGLKKFLIHLLTENPKHRDLFLTWTAFSLGSVSIKMNIGDSVSVLRLAIPHLQVDNSDLNTLKDFARHFDVFNSPEGIKEIYNIHAKGKIHELEEKCLELLEKHDPDFVEEQRAAETTTNTESEEADESEPTE